MEEVNKNQLFILCTSSCAGRTSEDGRSQLQNKPRLLGLSKALVQISFKQMLILCMYSTLWRRVAQVYHKLRNELSLSGFWLWSSTLSNLTWTFSGPLLLFPFVAFSIFNKQNLKASGRAHGIGRGKRGKDDIYYTYPLFTSFLSSIRFCPILESK